MEALALVALFAVSLAVTSAAVLGLCALVFRIFKSGWFWLAVAVVMLAVSCQRADAASVPSGTDGVVSIGGGSFDLVFFGMLTALLGLVWGVRTLQRYAAGLRSHINELENEITELYKKQPTAFALRDITASWQRSDDDPDRMLMLKFTTVAGMNDFHSWLRIAHYDAKQEARR